MHQRHKVVICDFINDDLVPERNLLGDLSDVVAYGAYHEDELAGRIEDADAIMLYHNLSLTRKTLEMLRQCKLIVRCGVGVDNVDHAYARTRGIAVSNVPDYGTEEVADSALAMALALARGVHPLNSMIRGGRDPYSYTQVVPLQRLRSAVFGIVGLGRIGTATALRAKAFGMDVAFYDPYVMDGYDKAVGCRRVKTFEELLEQTYILSLHCPLTDETRHLINGKTLARLPQGAFLINTARGRVVDTSLLPDALMSGQLAGAGIDVIAQEPPDADDPLVTVWRDPKHPAHHRLILNPHSAFYSEQGLQDMRVKGASACREALLGKLPRNIVN